VSAPLEQVDLLANDPGPEETGSEDDRLLRAAFDAAADGIAVVDPSSPDLPVVRSNRRLCEVLAVAAGGLDAVPLVHWTDTQGVATLRDLVAWSRRGDRPRAGEIQLNPVTGSARWMRVTVAVLPGQSVGRAVVTFTDISDRRAIDTVTATLPVELVGLDRELRIRWANPTAARAMGFGIDQLIGQSWPQLMPTAVPHQAVYDRVLAGESLDFECVPMGLKEGCLRYFRTSLRPLRDAGGDITGMIAMAQDVTDREIARQENAAAQHRFTALVERANDIITIISGDGTLTYGSPSVAPLTGYAPEDMVGKRIEDFVHPDDLAYVRERVAIASARSPGDIGPAASFRFHHRNGGWIWLEATASNSLGDPAVNGIVVVARDITARRQIESSLAEERHKLDLALSGAKVGTWDYDVATGVHWFDGRCVALLGRSEPEIRVDLDALAAMTHPDDVVSARQRLVEHLRGETSWYETEYRVRNVAGEWCWVIARGRAAHRDANGRVTRIAGVIMNIDDRKRAEYEAQTHADFLRTAVAGGKVGLWSWDAVTGERRVSDSWLAMCGYTRQEWLRQSDPWQQRIHPEDRERVVNSLSELVTGQKDSIESDVEYRFQSMSGDWRWFSARAHVADRDPAGRSTRIVGRVLDITPTMKLRQFLQETQAAAGVGGWEMNLRSGELSWTDETYALFETTREEFQPTMDNTMPLYAQPYRAPISVVVEAAMRRGEPFDIEVESRTLRGRPIWLRLIGKAEIIEGQAVRLYGAKQDITRRREADAALRRQALVFETLREGVVVFDGSGVIRIANAAADAMFGWPPRGLGGRSVTEIGFDLQRIAEHRQMVAPHHGVPLEWKARRADGSSFTAESVLSDLQFPDEPLTIAVVMDVTDRKMLERAIIDASNREQQRIGHDLHDGLGQELTGISLMLRSYATRAASEYPKGAPLIDEVVDLVNHAVESARALAHGLSPVILERGGLPAALAQLAASATRTHGMKVQFRKSVTGPLALDSTAIHHLYRIAQEAVTNAARHSRASVVTVRLASGEDHVRLTISDDGCGIPMSRPRSSGDGMGLRIMEFRARMIHAKFSVERTRRGGTRISCRLPLTPAH